MLSWKIKAIAFAALIGIVGLITAYVFEFRYLSNTIGAGKLIGFSALAGSLLAAMVARPLALRESDGIGKLRLWLGLALMGAMFGPLFGSWLNRLPSRREPVVIQARFIEEKPYAQRPFGVLEGETVEPDGYYIFVLFEDAIHRFQSPVQRFRNAKKNEMVELPMRKGLLGFRLVDFY